MTAVWLALLTLNIGQPRADTDCNSFFTDQELTQWISSNTNGLILLVSDGMPYSQESVEMVQSEAARRKISYQLVSDRAGYHQHLRCDPVLKSDVLISKGGLRHYPTLFFVKNHLLLDRVIPGAQTREELTQTLNELFPKTNLK